GRGECRDGDGVGIRDVPDPDREHDKEAEHDDRADEPGPSDEPRQARTIAESIAPTRVRRLAPGRSVCRWLAPGRPVCRWLAARPPGRWRCLIRCGPERLLALSRPRGRPRRKLVTRRPPGLLVTGRPSG